MWELVIVWKSEGRKVCTVADHATACGLARWVARNGRGRVVRMRPTYRRPAFVVE